MEDNILKKPNITIYNIAKFLNISPSTVSRALNNKKTVSTKTRIKVAEAAKLLNYTPNIAATYLKNHKSHQIMLSLPYIVDEFFIEMISAIQAVAKSNNYSLILEYTEGDKKEEINVIRNANNNFIDGMIMVSLNFTRKHIEEIKKLSNIPLVLSSICSNRIEDRSGLFDYVGVDTREGIFLATNHLIEQGHTKIGFIGHDLNTMTGNERYKGFCLAMDNAGYAINKDYIITGEFRPSFGYEAGIKYVNMKDPVTAICASADLMVLGLYRAFEQEKIRVPEDISIIGMDNINTSTLVKPKISTVALSQGIIGKTAADLIFSRLAGSQEPPNNIIFKPRLIIRESSINISKNTIV